MNELNYIDLFAGASVYLTFEEVKNVSCKLNNIAH